MLEINNLAFAGGGVKVIAYAGVILPRNNRQKE